MSSINNIFYQNTYEQLSTPKKVLTKIVAIFAALFTLGLAYEPTFRWMVTHLSNDSNRTTQNISTVAASILPRPSENHSYIPELARALGVSDATLNSTQLWLYSRKLTKIPTSIGKLSQLHDLDFSNNQLTTVPASIGNLTQLYSLGLSKNKLTTVPPALGNLTKLDKLWLNGNQLTTVPPTLGNLSQMQHLWLDHNQLTTIPDTLGNLSQLQRLWLNSNRLTTVPECLFRLPRNCHIDLRDNPIPQVVLRALYERINAPDYTGPSFTLPQTVDQKKILK